MTKFRFRFLLLILGIIVGLLLLFFTGYITGPTISEPVETTKIESIESNVASQFEVNTNGESQKNRFYHAGYGFAFSLPLTYQVQVFDEGNDSTTLVVIDEGNPLFQIFITPYPASEITSSRIALDAPTATTEEPTEIIIGDNTRALMFLSSEPILGSLREVWFLHRGYLYEVTGSIDIEPIIQEVLHSIDLTY